MSSCASKRTLNVTLTALMLAAAGWAYQSTHAFGATPREEVFSFDMWCLEMKLYPSQRCDARRSEDVKSYEQYRSDVEKFATARNTRGERDKQVQQQLNRDITPAKPASPPR
jgi:hypothetical protein